jgi:hypothetical protein
MLIWIPSSGIRNILVKVNQFLIYRMNYTLTIGLISFDHSVKSGMEKDDYKEGDTVYL